MVICNVGAIRASILFKKDNQCHLKLHSQGTYHHSKKLLRMNILIILFLILSYTFHDMKSAHYGLTCLSPRKADTSSSGTAAHLQALP